MMKFLLGTTMFAGLMVAGVAQAADMPLKAQRAAPQYFTWTGCYIGVNAGWGRAEHDLSTFAAGAPNNINATARTAINNAGLASINGDGFTGGGTVGCNWQTNNWVWGIEGDFNFANFDADRNTGNVVEPVSGRTVRSIDSVGTDWFATLRGRFGIAFDRVLIYGTGGAAFAKFDISKRFAWDFIDGCPIVGGLQECHVGGISDTRIGWVAGGGIEWAFASGWSVKGEYLFADFGSVSYTTANVGPGFVGAGNTQLATHSVDTTVQIVRFGLNYRWGAAY
jgi:outer membrane immunogenic protein